MVFKRQITNDEITQPDSADFEKMLFESFGKTDRNLKVGDRIKAEVLSVGKEQVIVSTGTRFDGFVSAAQLCDETGASKVKTGDQVDLFVTYVKGSQIFLSPHPTAQNLAEDLQEAYEKGFVVSGRVESVNKGGFQVIVFGKAAFCPMSQMDLRRVEGGEEYIGKTFPFHVTQVSEGGRNIVVSRRKILEESQGLALSTFKDQRKVGDTVTGKVTRLQDFGAFIEIAPGMEGLAHVSELSWTRVKHPSEVLKVGDVVTATILRIEENDRKLKISLTLKEAANDPWVNLTKTLQSGQVIECKITRCMPFGAFAEVQPGIEGLIPLSEMSSVKRVARAEEAVQAGQTVKVLVKEINPQSKRISLSIRDAVERAATESENENIREYNESQKVRAQSGSMSDLGAKLQAALAQKK